MVSTEPRYPLWGRRVEQDALGRLVGCVRDGHSRSLVLRGDAGVGKTALLEYLAECGADLQVVRAAGVESEMELAYAALHQLCAPMLDRLPRLPGPQRDALQTAFGTRSGPPPDRFVVGLAGLNLLAEYAADRPVLCVVDDAQWLDRISAQALTFIARRLVAERVALVFAVREDADHRVDQMWTGLDELRVTGLSDDDARGLLDSAVPGRLDERVRDRIVAETRGNPLALLELPRGLSVAELAGGFGSPDAGRLANQIEHTFLRRVRALPAETQRLLLTAAAEPVGDVVLLRRAAELSGIGPDAAIPAQEAGLLELGTRVRFRHPLTRSAAYRSGTVSDRQAAHRALAEATDGGADPDRRAWHRAAAATGPDEEVAGDLERSADRALARGGVAAAAAFLRKAAVLTPEPRCRAARAIAAAEAQIDAAAPDSAHELLAMAELGPLDPSQRARLARLRAQIVFARNHGSDAAPLLLDAAKQLEALHDAQARDTYLEALGAAVFAGRLGGIGTLRATAEAALTAPPAPDPPGPVDLLLDGVATRFTKGCVASVPLLRRALDEFLRGALRGEAELTRWLWLAWPLAADLWDYATSHELATRAVRVARESGALTALPVALAYRAGVHVFAGEFDAAETLSAEADAITAATGYAPVAGVRLVLTASRGDEMVTAQLADTVVAGAAARGEGRTVGSAAYATAVLNNAVGRYDAALSAARTACEFDDPGYFGWALAELVEAGVRGGDPVAAARAARTLQQRTSVAGTDWALGVQARANALLSTGAEAEAGYREGIERLARTPIAVQLGRAHLLYGEWLRREGRRSDARRQLRLARGIFGDVGADAFLQRAQRELAATGESVRRRSTTGALTGQEARIAALAAAGLTNPQIGAQLYLSPHTVEWHLRKVFAKLAVASRRHLADALARTTVPTTHPRGASGTVRAPD